MDGAEDDSTLKEGMRELGAHRTPRGHHRAPRAVRPVRAAGHAGPGGQEGQAAPCSLPKGMEGDSITLEQALGLLSLPRHVGLHPETGEALEVGIGRFGPYVKMGPLYASLDRDDDVLAIGLNRAVDAIQKKLESVRQLGAHPKTAEPVVVKKGPVRSVYPGRPGGGQRAARHHDGRGHARPGGGAAGGTRQAAEATGRRTQAGGEESRPEGEDRCGGDGNGREAGSRRSRPQRKPPQRSLP